MSGSPNVPVVDLLGSPMSALVGAIPVITARTGRQVTLIGGLAVVCRLTRPYRATSDLDTVNRRGEGEPAQLELLLASGVERSGPAGVLIPTDAGPVQVDVLEVTDANLEQLPEDPTDRLHILSHAWAATTATPVLREQLSAAEAQLRADAALHVERFFDRHVARSPPPRSRCAGRDGHAGRRPSTRWRTAHGASPPKGPCQGLSPTRIPARSWPPKRNVPGTCQPVHADTPTSADGTERPQSPNVPTSMIACLKPMDRSRAEC